MARRPLPCRSDRAPRPADGPRPPGDGAGSGGAARPVRVAGAVWRAVDGDGGDASPYRALVRSSAARWATARLADRGERALPRAAGRLARGDAPRRSWRRGARSTGPARVEPWDYWYSVGAAARRLDAAVGVDRMLDVNRRYLASLGADPDVLGIALRRRSAARAPADPGGVHDRGWALRDRRARGRRGSSRRTQVGGLGEPRRAAPRERPCRALRRRSGHGRHSPNGPTRETAFLEGTADVLGWDATEPAWQRHWLGEAATPREALLDRYGAVDVRHRLGALRDRAPPPPGAPPERRLDRARDRRPRHRAASRVVVVGDPRPARSSSPATWRTTRCRRSSRPRSGQRTPRSAVRGSTGDPGWYAFMSERLFAAGASRSPADLLEAFLGEPLTAEPLLADLRRR